MACASQPCLDIKGHCEYLCFSFGRCLCVLSSRSAISTGLAGHLARGYDRVDGGVLVITYKSMDAADKLQVLHRDAHVACADSP
jgi:hypothetical protein